MTIEFMRKRLILFPTIVGDSWRLVTRAPDSKILTLYSGNNIIDQETKERTAYFMMKIEEI